MNEKPYLLVDLDGTLAEFTTWQGIEHIGDPILPELEYVKGMKSKIGLSIIYEYNKGK